MSAHIHLTPLTGIKIDFKPPASCIIGSTENKSALLEIVFTTMKLMPQRGFLISCLPCTNCISSPSGILMMPEGPRHLSKGWTGPGNTPRYRWHPGIHTFPSSPGRYLVLQGFEVLNCAVRDYLPMDVSQPQHREVTEHHRKPKVK